MLYNLFYRNDHPHYHHKETHGKQLLELNCPHCPELLRRSALGLAKVYNLLPAEVVQETSVHEFQSKLQELVKLRANAGCSDWKDTLSPRVAWWNHPLR